MITLSAEQKRELLSKVPFFEGFAARELDALVPAARSIEVPARKELFHKGDAGSQLYVVIEGRLKALTTSLEGNDVVFNVMGAGEVFGEVALLSESPRTATVRAIERCRLLVLDRRDFLAFLKKNHPDVAVRMLTVLVERLKRSSEFVEDIQFLNLPVRLAKKFMHFADRYGRESDGALKIEIKLSQEEWGDMVGATRESINKQMRAWSEDGLIQVDGGFVTLLKPEEIERLAFSTL